MANGYQALYSNTIGSINTAAGRLALASNIPGIENTAHGASALRNNTTGNKNTALGRLALFSNTDGGRNAATGHNALQSNTTGNDNVANGLEALYNNTIGGGNIAVGAGAGFNLTTGNGNIDIGNEGVADEANTIRIGGDTGYGSQTATFIVGISGVTTSLPGVPVLIDANGRLGTVSSSRRFKNEIKPMDKASEAIRALKPVTFHYKSDKTCTPQFGLIAEEVAEVNPDLVVRDEKGEIYTVRYDAVNAMLLNEFLKEYRKVEEQEETIAQLKSDGAKQEVTITQLKSTVAQEQASDAEQQNEIKALAATLKEQASLIQKVSDKVELNKSAPQVVANRH